MFLSSKKYKEKILFKKNIQDLKKKWGNKIDLFDLDLIVANELSEDRSFVISYPDFKLDFFKKNKIEKKLKKRAKGVPLAYLQKNKEFYGRDFFVNENVLIPRPETELIIESIMQKVKENDKSFKNFLVLDIGTGSGNIIITLTKELKKEFVNFDFIATDISKKALKIAQKNAKNHKVESLINFFQSDLLKNEKLKNEVANFESEILLIANLPYVNEDFKSDLLKKPESKSLIFEPQTALWSGEDGLNHYIRLIETIKNNENLRNKKFTFYFEISPEQNELLKERILNYFPKAKIEFKKDLAGLNRLCVWKNL